MPPKKRTPKGAMKNQVVDNKEELFEGKRYFKDPKIISEHLMCVICQDVFTDPWRLTCGHTFCKECVMPWLDVNTNCPVDRLPVVKAYMHKDILVANIIGDYLIACPWRPFGCNRIDKYYIMMDHKTKCAHNPNNMDKIMQQAALKIYNDIPLSPMNLATPPSKKTRVSTSAFDELMNELADHPLDSSLVESETNMFPETEVLPLSMRMYIHGDAASKNYVCNMLNTAAVPATKTATGKRSKKK